MAMDPLTKQLFEEQMRQLRAQDPPWVRTHNGTIVSAAQGAGQYAPLGTSAKAYAEQYAARQRVRADRNRRLLLLT